MKMINVEELIDKLVENDEQVNELLKKATENGLTPEERSRFFLLYNKRNQEINILFSLLKKLVWEYSEQESRKEKTFKTSHKSYIKRIK